MNINKNVLNRSIVGFRTSCVGGAFACLDRHPKTPSNLNSWITTGFDDFNADCNCICQDIRTEFGGIADRSHYRNQCGLCHSQYCTLEILESYTLDRLLGIFLSIFRTCDGNPKTRSRVRLSQRH